MRSHPLALLHRLLDPLPARPGRHAQHFVRLLRIRAKQQEKQEHGPLRRRHWHETVVRADRPRRGVCFLLRRRRRMSPDAS